MRLPEGLPRRSGSGKSWPKDGELTITPVGTRLRVTCQAHNLDRTVDTDRHATNIMTLHQRVDHASELGAPAPGVLHLSAAAAKVLDSDRGSERGGALMVWQALTGLEGEAALAFARSVREHRTTAAIIPF